MNSENGKNHANMANLYVFGDANNTLNELKKIVSDMETLLDKSELFSTDELLDINNRMREKIKSANDLLANRTPSITERVTDISTKANSYIHDKPWKAVGMAMAVGAVLGCILSSSRQK